MEKVITISNLVRDYKNNHGVFDLSFDVKKGEIFGFLGPNGAGKTTTIRHLTGFLKPEKGSCSINGLDCWKESNLIHKTLGYLPGEIVFFDDMSGLEFLHFLISYKKIKNSRLDELVKLFELDTKVKIKKMSKGMKQKVALIAAFLHDPDVLILDEPTSGLDPLMQNKFIELIWAEKARGKTILISSHIFEEIEKICDRVGIIKDGKLVAVNSIEELKENQIKKFVVSFADNEQATKFANEKLNIESVKNNHATVVIQNNFNEFISVLSKYNITNITAKNQSLEEIFMKYYGGNND